jgi:hypothetical protein
MSKRINVNPDHYKVAGRERPGDALAKPPKQAGSLNDEVKARERWQRTRATQKTKTARGRKPI